MALPRPASLHDILIAWQAGEIGYREALDRSKIETLDELYDAAALSGVPLSAELDAVERAQATRVAALIRDQIRQAA